MENVYLCVVDECSPSTLRIYACASLHLWCVNVELQLRWGCRSTVRTHIAGRQLLYA